MRRNYWILAILLVAWTPLAAQTPLVRGIVVERTGTGATTPVVGANVYWLGTVTGTLTDTSGVFALPRVAAAELLVVSAVGYLPDTVRVGERTDLRVNLQATAPEVAGVEVVGERASTVVDYLSPARTDLMTEKELVKAACCNLSESFETNPSIDVTFADAVTGTRQIEMLGLAGVYSQITMENLPAIRGLTSHVGLTFVPGPWIKSIQVSKGVGSVANGYESITGQINVELRKPAMEEESPFYVNLFGNNEERLESNLHFRQEVGSHLASMTMAHLGSQQRAMDGNGDRFLDSPLSRTVNLLQRFAVTGIDNLESGIVFQYVSDEKDGGTLHGVRMGGPQLAAAADEYGYRMRSRQVSAAGKTGFILSQEDLRSVGSQWSWKEYRQSSRFGQRVYEGSQRTGYLNLLYDTRLNADEDRIRFGGSFLYDEVDETLDGDRFRRVERVPGAFAEYTFHPFEGISVVAGLRGDYHDRFGGFLTPRLHLRYSPDPDWVIRMVAGRGARTASFLAENIAALASARALIFPRGDPEYPFQQEVAWNTGVNLTHYFLWDYREGTLSLDFYRTSFTGQVVVDLDRSPREVVFENLSGASMSNSLQAELTLQPVERLDLRAAYRFLDVRQSAGGVERERPFVARHRAFLNIAYASERENENDPRMSYDLTLQWTGKKRLPLTGENPEAFRAREVSPPFVLVNAQVARSFSAGFDLYLGVENLFGFRQDTPVIDAEHPGSSYFDSSLLWGPVNGRVIYGGLRWGIR